MCSDQNIPKTWLFAVYMGLYYQVYNRDYMGLYDSNKALSGSRRQPINGMSATLFCCSLGDLQASVRLKEKLVEMEAAKTSAEEREHTNY